jgi:ABC-type branched-subunit amino acid transport system permease subunit
MAVSAAVGALVALPALRLRGLYLALATFAFGVFVSRMVLTEISARTLPLVHWTFTIFPSGTLSVARPKIGPIDLKSNAAFLVAVTIVFAVIGIALVAIRHSGYGRRLAALKDSPAACATLGMNVVRLKLSVFMLSAAIAGLGGALMSSQLGSVNLDRFDIFLSLGLLMLTVVGGIGYVSGALVGGLLLGVGFVAIQDTFTKLGTDHPTLNGVFGFVATLTTVLPAIIGVSLGRNPSGAVHQIVENYRPLRRAVPLLVAAAVVEAVVYWLTYTEHLSGWWFVILTAVVILGLPGVAKAVTRSDGPRPVPDELVGIDRAFTDDDRTTIDRELGLVLAGGGGNGAAGR